MTSDHDRITKTVKLRPVQRADHAEMVAWVSAQPAATWQEVLTTALLYYVRRHSALHCPIDQAETSGKPPSTTPIPQHRRPGDASAEIATKRNSPEAADMGKDRDAISPSSTITGDRTRSMPSITDFDDDDTSL